MYCLIGDIHGCLAELQQLWSQLPLSKITCFVFLGDLIDRGPDSDGVLAFVQNIQSQYKTIIIRGNHEYKALKRIKNKGELSFTPTPEHIALLQSTLPYYPFAHDTFLALHGGIYPAFWENHPQLPPPGDEAFWDKKLSHRIFRMSICRYINTLGQIVTLGEETDADVFWAEIYDGRAGHIFFGHQPYMNGIQHFPHATGLDTGCVFGGALSAALVVPGEKTRFVSVPSQKAYAQGFFEEERK